MAPYNTPPLYESSIEDEDTGSDTESESEPEDEEWLENERLRQEMEEERLEDERLQQEMEEVEEYQKQLPFEEEMRQEIEEGEYQQQLLFEEEMRQETEEEEYQQQLLFEEEMRQETEEEEYQQQLLFEEEMRQETEEEEYQQQLLFEEEMRQETEEEEHQQQLLLEAEMQQGIGEQEYKQQLLEEEEIQKYYEEMSYDDDHDDDSLIPIPTPISNPPDIGPFLYRVFDDESISVYNSDGFIAGASEMPTDSEEFSYMVENHADWCSRVMTPFISTTNSLDVANWQITLRDRPGIKVAIIDTSTLIGEFGVQVWEILKVMDDFGIEPPGRCTRRTFADEYICGLHIPDSAVVSVCEPERLMDVVELYLF